MTRRRVALVGALLCLGGCAQWSRVPAGPVTIGSRYVLASPIDWSQKKDGEALIWTVNGARLELLAFFNGIEDGDPLFELSLFAGREEKERAHRFRSGMDAFEIRELFVNTWRGMGWESVEARSLRPWSFGPWPGFRFDTACMSVDGLEYRGLVVGAEIDARLYMILYQAPGEHYHPAYEAHVESMLSSIRAR